MIMQSLLPRPQPPLCHATSGSASRRGGGGSWPI